MSADPTGQDAEPRRDPPPSVTDALFRAWRSPRFGRSNPERLNNPVWEWLIESGWSAYAATSHFGHARSGCGDPGWSFSRFGQSSTRLSDGRLVLVAGEHEDAYDPDFHIYNDVVVRHPDGRTDIYGYPRDVFAPTDFHSATLVGDRVVIVGCLGYPADRTPGVTLVAVLDLTSFAISSISTRAPAPGWIHRHHATLAHDGRAIVVQGGKVVRGTPVERELIENPDDWRLDLATWRWERLTERAWTQWRIARVDGQPNRLWQVRSAAMLSGRRWAREHRESMETMIRDQLEQLARAYGAPPDLELFGRLYRPAIGHDALPDVDDEFNVHRITIDGIVVRYVEGSHGIHVIVEGALPATIVAVVTEDLRGKLAALEHAAYVVTAL